LCQLCHAAYCLVWRDLHDGWQTGRDGCSRSLALGGVDLTSPAGKMTMGVIAAVAQFERDLLIERTLSGQARARAEGKTFGRKPVLDGEQRQKALQRLSDGASISAVAREIKTSRATIRRLPCVTRLSASILTQPWRGWPRSIVNSRP
jgi:hypothetical protein